MCKGFYVAYLIIKKLNESTQQLWILEGNSNLDLQALLGNNKKHNTEIDLQ